jgi:hypothetical protein
LKTILPCKSPWVLAKVHGIWSKVPCGYFQDQANHLRSPCPKQWEGSCPRRFGASSSWFFVASGGGLDSRTPEGRAHAQ